MTSNNLSAQSPWHKCHSTGHGSIRSRSIVRAGGWQKFGFEWQQSLIHSLTENTPFPCFGTARNSLCLTVCGTRHLYQLLISPELIKHFIPFQRHGLIPMDEDTAENNVVQVGRGDRTPPNQHHPEPPFGLPSFLWSPFRSGHTQLREERRQQLTSRGSPISPSRFRHSGHTP